MLTVLVARAAMATIENARGDAMPLLLNRFSDVHFPLFQA